MNILLFGLVLLFGGGGLYLDGPYLYPGLGLGMALLIILVVLLVNRPADLADERNP